MSGENVQRFDEANRDDDNDDIENDAESALDDESNDESSSDDSDEARFDAGSDDKSDVDRFSVTFLPEEPLLEYHGAFVTPDFFRWDGVAPVPGSFGTMWIRGNLKEKDELFCKLLDLLRQDPRRWSEINITGQHDTETSSPEHMSLLHHCLTRTESLGLSGCTQDTAAFERLNDGLKLDKCAKKLSLWHCPGQPMTRAQADVFSRGLASAVSLEALSLPCDLTTSGVGAALARGLQLNRTLLTLDLIWCRYEEGVLPLLLASLQDHPSLRKLGVRAPSGISEEAMSELSAWLGRDDCLLEHLDAWHNALQMHPMPSLSRECLCAPNRSVKKLELVRTGLDCIALGSFMSKFSSLIALNLSENNIDYLTPLDGLLCGNAATLEELDLSKNRIGAIGVQHLTRQMSQLKTLKKLDIRSNPFSASESSVTALVDALEENTSLQRFAFYSAQLEHSLVAELEIKVDKVMTVNKLHHHLNRTMHRLPKPMPLELCPLLLEGMSDLRHHGDKDLWESRLGRSARATALCSLLRTHECMLFRKRFPNALIAPDLSENKINCLTPLDGLLCGSAATLEELSLCNNRISLNGIDYFAGQTSQMRTLKKPHVTQNPFSDSETCVTALVDTLEGNTSLESFSWIAEWRAALSDTLVAELEMKVGKVMAVNKLHQHLNAIAYRLARPIPIDLHSLVLERASHLRHYKNKDLWESCLGRSARATASYSLLQKDDSMQFNM